MPLPLVVVAIYEMVMGVVAWCVANPLTASAVVTGAATLAEVDMGDVARRARNALAAVINGVAPFNFEGGDFESGQRFKAALAREIAGKSGIAIRDITDRDLLREDLEIHALGMIEQKTGYRISSLTNLEVVKGDMLKIGSSIIAERVGIRFSDLSNVETIKSDLLAWGQDQIMVELSKNLESALNTEYTNGVSLMQMMKTATGRDVSPRELLSGLRSATMQRYAERSAAVQVETKADRRRLQNRINQKRFRDKHKKGSSTYDRSGRPVYIPIGWDYRAHKREG